MNVSITKLPTLVSAALALAFTLSSSAFGEVLLEDDFSPGSGESSPSSVAARHPSKGPNWEGMAMVKEGLVHDQELVFSAAYSEINVPSDFKKLIVKICYRPMCGLQIGFGFANSAQNLLDNRGPNAGLMWVNTAARQVMLHAGIYGSGENVEGLPIPSTVPIPKLVEMEFEVENPDTGTYLGRIVANGQELASQEVTPTQPPTFRYFFIQFRGEEGKAPNQAIVEHVSVEVESK